MTYTYTTQRQVRAAFWESIGGVIRKPARRDHSTDVRCLFVDFVDALARNGDISEALAQRVTL